MSVQAKAKVFIDNQICRVTEWRFAPGASTGWHEHEYDYVVVPLTTGQLKLVSEDGENIADLTAGQPYFKNLGVQHDVININDFEFVFIETEFLK